MEMEKKTIWVLLPNLRLGGTEVFLTSLASELHDNYKFIFFINHNEIEIKNLKFEIKSSSNTLKFLTQILAAGWRTRPDIIISSIVDINIISLLLKKLLPRKTKHIIREALSIEDACALTKAPSMYRWLAYRTYPYADAIVSLSTELHDHLEKRIPHLCKQTKHVIIPNGVRKERMQDFPLSEYSRNKVIAIGRLEYQKGFDQLIEAFLQFSSGTKDYELLIIGEGSERSTLEEIIRKHSGASRIRLIGKKEDPIPELVSSAFFVLPSRYEGLSNALLEALVNGVPVLATKQGTSAAEVIDDSNGVLINRCTREEILKGLIRMDANFGHFSREAIAINARNKLSITASAKEFSRLFDSI